MRGRVVGTSRCGAEARGGACLRRRAAGRVRAGAGGRAGLRPVVAAAGWPARAAPSSSAQLGAVVVGVSLPRREGKSNDAEGGWHPVAGSHRAECDRVVVVQRHGAFPCPSALAHVAALRRCLGWGALPRGG